MQDLLLAEMSSDIVLKSTSKLPRTSAMNNGAWSNSGSAYPIEHIEDGANCQNCLTLICHLGMYLLWLVRNAPEWLCPISEQSVMSIRLAWASCFESVSCKCMCFIVQARCVTWDICCPAMSKISAAPIQQATASACRNDVPVIARPFFHGSHQQWHCKLSNALLLRQFPPPPLT